MFATLFMLAGASAGVAPHEALFLDGSCAEYTTLGAETHAVMDGATLHLAETDSALWICLTVPDDALGLVDLRVHAPGLSAPVNLHVSAQLGEWPADDADAAPTAPDSPTWWNQRGWYANWVPLLGFRQVDGKSQPNFARGTARELVLQKARFGRGEYRLGFELRLHADPAVVTVFPPAQGGAPGQIARTVY